MNWNRREGVDMKKLILLGLLVLSGQAMAIKSHTENHCLPLHGYASDKERKTITPASSVLRAGFSLR